MPSLHAGWEGKLMASQEGERAAGLNAELLTTPREKML